MKKLLLVGLFAFAFAGAQAQELGIRSGVSAGNNVAVDALLSVGEFSRIHANASVGGGIGVDVLWDFFYRPFDISGENGFGWYMGVGPSMYAGRRYGHWGNDPLLTDNVFLLGASFEIGIDYHFDFPLALAVDYRPTFWIVEETHFGAGGFGVMARYCFGK
ncbi:outer membrane insertion C- signal [Reichenbachiella ulvae]|uniref:Outer membrane insertion C- signal n=1 Tax=Reichenbachiella ulvae TaxID=2980104 RepID=A0ABT3CQ95_9BACT|nr:outer membrane insertion C- signal [Reichenbachiella ulvae]MCV9385438.1 outer membrane insertion C- signal [Reichenbachiella ulvae]